MPTDRYRELCATHRWHVPPDFNIARAVCGRHAGEEARVALLWEDESGATAQYTYRELQQQANRLSNCSPRAVSVARIRSRSCLPAAARNGHCPYRLLSAGCGRRAAVVPVRRRRGSSTGLPIRMPRSRWSTCVVAHLAPIHDKLPLLADVIGVAGARESWTEDWDAALAMASDRFDAVATRATDPAP